MSSVFGFVSVVFVFFSECCVFLFIEVSLWMLHSYFTVILSRLLGPRFSSRCCFALGPTWLTEFGLLCDCRRGALEAAARVLR